MEASGPSDCLSSGCRHLLPPIPVSKVETASPFLMLGSVGYRQGTDPPKFKERTLDSVSWQVGVVRFWKNTWGRRYCYGHLWRKAVCPGLPSGHNNSHLSTCKIHSCASKILRKSHPIMASGSGSKSRALPSNHVLDTHPEHNRRIGLFKVCPKEGKPEAHGTMAVVEFGQLPVACSFSTVLFGSWFHALGSYFYFLSDPSFFRRKSQCLQLSSLLRLLPAPKSLGIWMLFSFCTLSVLV